MNRPLFRFGLLLFLIINSLYAIAQIPAREWNSRFVDKKYNYHQSANQTKEEDFLLAKSFPTNANRAGVEENRDDTNYWLGNGNEKGDGNDQLKRYTALPADKNRVNDTLNKVITKCAEPGQVSHMQPAPNSTNLSLPLNLSWFPATEATKYDKYDIYIWPYNTAKPTTPTVDGIISFNYLFSKPIPYGTTYQWQVVAKNNCSQTAGPVQVFTLRDLPDLAVNSVEMPVTAFSGQTMSISWQVKNEGSGSTVQKQWFDAVYLSKGATLNLVGDSFVGDSLMYKDSGYLGAVPNVSALEPGKSYPQVASFNIPQGITGNYYVFLVTNPFRGGLLESTKKNNVIRSTSTTFIRLTPPPDLQVTSIVRPSNAFSGQKIDLSWTVKNEGSGSSIATSWNDRIYLARDITLDTAKAVSLGSFSHKGILNAEDSYTHTESVILPEGIFGTYYLYVQTDEANRVYEHAAESNNTTRSDTVQVLLTPPIDLVVSQITIPEQASNQESISVSWKVENQGGTSAEGQGWLDYIYISESSTFDPSAAKLVGQLRRTEAVAPGESYTAQQNITIPPHITGNAYLYITTDAKKGVFEYIHENNNTSKSNSILHIVSPDLVVSNLKIPETATSGNLCEIEYTIKNTGAGTLYNRNLTDRVVLSSSAKYNPNSVIDLKHLTYQTGTLLAGADTTLKVMVKLPNAISGTYYPQVFTDYPDSVYENTNENNNKCSTSPLEITLSPWADLQVSQVQVKDTATAGETVALQFTVANKGSLPIKDAAWIDKIFISNSSEWDSTKATLLKKLERAQLLQKDSAYQVNTTISLPPGIGASNYYVHILTDAANTVYEHTSELNNIQPSNPIYINKPLSIDLVVTAVTAPPSGASGKPVKVQWTVKNAGETSTFSTSWYDALYLSEDTVWQEGTDVLFGKWKQNGSLAPGKSYTPQQNFTLPNGVSGDYYLLLVVDHTDLNKDVARKNNYKLVTDSNDKPVTIQIELTPPPDLIVSEFTVPTEVRSEQPVTMKWTIKNAGSGSTLVGSWTDRIYLSTDLKIDEKDNPIGSYIHQGALAPGASYRDSLGVYLPITATGNYALIIKSDYHNAVYEYQNEKNNTAITLISVVKSLQSDLVVSAVTGPSSVIAGQSVNVQWKVKNKGENPATGTMQEAVYLSTDTLKDGNDILLGTRTEKINLAPLAEASHRLTGNLSGASLKDYYLLVHTDIVNNINESNETNNVTPSGEKLKVTVPDLLINKLSKANLENKSDLYYRIEVSEALQGESLLITLKGDSTKGANEMYLHYGEMPTRAQYDYIHDQPFKGNQEILIPELRQGTYYVRVSGNTSAGEIQKVSLLASVLKFRIQTVHATSGGNTGPVTIAINGSKLGALTAVRLMANGKTIVADSLRTIDPTKVFAAFNLAGATLGTYDVVAENTKGKSAVLKKSFTIVAGKASNLVTNVIAPPVARHLTVISLKVQFSNMGNTDLINPVLQLSSLAGSPIGFTTADLKKNHNQLTLVLRELNGPSGILRPGGIGTIVVYTKATSALYFMLKRP